MNVGIYIYDDVEVLDVAGPYEVFSTASRLVAEQDSFDVSLISTQGQPVKARAGFIMTPDHSISSYPELDLLIVPGGQHEKEMSNSALHAWLLEQTPKIDIVASVCTGSFLLAQAGILTEHTVTTHWEDIPALKATFPALNVVSQRWVDLGKLLTSGGISAGIDMSLHLVSRLINEDLAQRTAKQMDYRWHKNDDGTDESL